MDDVRRQDLRLFSKELLNPGRVVITVAVLGVLYAQCIGGFYKNFPLFFVGTIVTLAIYATNAWVNSLKKRFIGKRYESLWRGCQDRLMRFEEVMRRSGRGPVSDLREMPRTMRRVADSLYKALRRADLVSSEVLTSERGLISQPPIWEAASHDPQSKELYRLADKNIAEYRAQFAGLMAGVERTEAQSAVFMTTVDTLRMKMLGYRLVGRSPEMNSQDFLEALAEARAQLQSIDTALEELDLGHYPKNIASVPPPPPSEYVIRQRLGG